MEMKVTGRGKREKHGGKKGKMSSDDGNRESGKRKM